jgi:hypothetical protein
MKAKELMIGDWVMINPISYYQVEQIRMEFGELRIYLKGTEVFATENEIMPIPLTPEILEKNGFEMVYDEYKLPNYRIKWKSYTNLFFTVFTGVDGYWNHVGFGVIIGGVPATLDYVHQLQHALRLCEIEKEIIL